MQDLATVQPTSVRWIGKFSHRTWNSEGFLPGKANTTYLDTLDSRQREYNTDVPQTCSTAMPFYNNSLHLVI